MRIRLALGLATPIDGMEWEEVRTLTGFRVLMTHCMSGLAKEELEQVVVVRAIRGRRGPVLNRQEVRVVLLVVILQTVLQDGTTNSGIESNLGAKVVVRTTTIVVLVIFTCEQEWFLCGR